MYSSVFDRFRHSHILYFRGARIPTSPNLSKALSIKFIYFWRKPGFWPPVLISTQGYAHLTGFHFVLPDDRRSLLWLFRARIFKLLRSPRIDSYDLWRNSAKLCSLAGSYDNPIPTRFLVPIDCLKIPPQSLLPALLKHKLILTFYVAGFVVALLYILLRNRITHNRGQCNYYVTTFICL